MPRVRVTLYSRVGCHLCTDARAVIEAVCAEFGVEWEERDVDARPEWRAAYSDHVPVTFVDDRQLSIWFLDADRLRAALRSAPAGETP